MFIRPCKQVPNCCCVFVGGFGCDIAMVVNVGVYYGVLEGNVRVYCGVVWV